MLKRKKGFCYKLWMCSWKQLSSPSPDKLSEWSEEFQWLFRPALVNTRSSRNLEQPAFIYFSQHNTIRFVDTCQVDACLLSSDTQILGVLCHKILSWMNNGFAQLPEKNQWQMPLEMDIMSRSNYSEAGLHKSKRRRSAKSHATNDDSATKKTNRKDPTYSANSVFNELLILNSSSPGAEDGQKPRSHANARERDRTHRCVMMHFLFVYAYLIMA